ncbi:KxYKxGKxW signal peptide domain-containing protein [Lactococcus cremoris]
MSTVISKSHFRTWKSGKSWLFATSALAGLMSNIFSVRYYRKFISECF